MASLLVLLVALVIVGFAAYKQHLRTRPARGLPPGPKPLPIVGNFLDMLPSRVPEYQRWLKHKDKYGLLSSVTVMGLTRVIIHDKQAATDLMEKISAVTSSRPATEFGVRLCGFGRFLGPSQYDDVYRRRRKLLHQEVGTKAAVARYKDVLEMEVGKFLGQLFARPENLFEVVENIVPGVVLKITYGYSVNYGQTDPLVNLISQMMSEASHAFKPFYWLVDIVPAISNLPDWLPGMGFKRIARRARKVSDLAADIPHQFVLRQMRNGSHQPSYVSKLVEQLSKGDENPKISREDEDTIKFSAATLSSGATDTLNRTIRACFLAMIMFPDVQRKAQEEIDQVIGNERLPQLRDREKLPYLDSVVKEGLRWFPALPIGVAHKTKEDITYGGYFIPKVALLSPAVWWFCHDPQVYTDPSSFDPSRFLEPRNEPDPIATFGYGRRICLGRHVAAATTFLIVAQFLAAFRIGKAVDEQGVEIEPAFKATDGIIRRLVDFPYKIVPRGEKQAGLIPSTTAEQREKGDSILLDEFTI